MTERRSYVAGRWVEGDRTFRVDNPADESTIAELSATPVSEVEKAVVEARRSFDDGIWSDQPAGERAVALNACLDYLESMHQAVVETCVAEAGQPSWFAEMASSAPA